jgi:hypothetical protein
MRSHYLLLLLAVPGLSPGVNLSALAAQAVPRTDSPRAGTLRVTFDPRVETWDAQFINGRRVPLGAPFTGDSSNVWFPSVTRLERDVRAVTGLSAFVATIGRQVLAIRAERRVTPIGLEFGVTNRLSLGVVVPLVRVNVAEGFRVSPPGSNLGRLLPGDTTRYGTFFGHLDAALTSLGDSIAAGAYGCPAGPACQRAQTLQSQAQALRDALHRAVYGTVDTAGLYLPLLMSDAGQSISSIVAGLERALVDTFRVAQFSRDTFLLPTAPVSGAVLDSVLEARLSAAGLSPFGGTTFRGQRYYAGDAELTARYRFLVAGNWAAAATLLVRLPTGHQDSPNDPFDVATGDHQTDIELRLAQEATLWRRLWLNLSLRAGQQRPGTRERRVAPQDAWLVPAAALARLDWDPGDYVAVDFAPLLRLGKHLGAGVTVGYFTKKRDHYTFPSATDSLDLATRLGAPRSASVLDAGTSERRLRLGAAVTYVGPNAEGGLSFEQTVSGYGGMIPVTTVLRVVMRTSRWPF